MENNNREGVKTGPSLSVRIGFGSFAACKDWIRNPPPLPLAVKFMWENREALGLTTTLTLEDLELHENAVLTVNAGERMV